MTVGAFLEGAEQIVKSAGEIAQRAFGTSPVVCVKEFNDVVTEADLHVQNHVDSRLRESYPDHGFVSEEACSRQTDAEYVWILDPIDGTKYYARGLPLYCISLALEKQGEPILGVVFSPETRQMFCGAKQRGATLDSRPIHCSKVTRLEESIIYADIPSRDSPANQRRWATERLWALLDRVRRVRVLGVSALGLCFCAMGGFDAYVSLASTTQHHDVAAGRVILTEAGGQFFQIGQQIVAGPPALCKQLLDLLGLPHEA